MHLFWLQEDILTQVYRLREHEKKDHDLVIEEGTKKFSCPFDCGVHAFRTNVQLISHCAKVHEEKLGKVINWE